MSVKIGINIVSLTHLAMRPRGLFFESPALLLETARTIGFDFVQVLPVRGIDKAKVAPDFCRFYEGAWNATALWQFITRQPGAAGTPSKLHDLVLFPDPKSCSKIIDNWENAGIRQISHEPRIDQLVELHPGLDMNPLELLKYCQRWNCRVVLDTSHIQDRCKEDPRCPGKRSLLGSSRAEWKHTTNTLGPVLADVMHFNVSWQQLLIGQNNEQVVIATELLEQWLALTEKYDDRFVVLEYKPPLSKRTNTMVGIDMHDRLRHLTELA